MVYTSGKKKELFAIKDPDMETKEIGFVNRSAMVGLGVFLGLIVATIVIFFSHQWLIGIAGGLLVGGMAGWIPVHADKKREKYYSPLIETIQDRLDQHGYEVSRQQVMDLLYLRDIRISDEHVLIATTDKKQLSIMICHNKKPERTKPEKKKFFETSVVGEPDVSDEPDVAEDSEASPEPEASEDEPDNTDVEEAPTVPETTVEAEDTADSEAVHEEESEAPDTEPSENSLESDPAVVTLEATQTQEDLESSTGEEPVAVDEDTENEVSEEATDEQATDVPVSDEVESHQQK